MKNNPNKIREVRRLLAEADHIDHNVEQDHDGIDRRGFLKCMAWRHWNAVDGNRGVLGSKILSPTSAGAAEPPMMGDFSFVQISDSHIGFNKPMNPDVVGTLKQAIAKINAVTIVGPGGIGKTPSRSR